MQFTTNSLIPGTPKQIYDLWLSSEGHSKMTGAAASCSDEVGGHFNAWEGYIQGVNLELEDGQRILQKWRTTEFEEEEEDSILEILFKEQDGMTQLTLIHSNLPDHGEQYRNGWEDHYFAPMKELLS